MRGAALAVSFFTRVPTPTLSVVGPAELAVAVALLPAVGVGVGAVLGVVSWAPLSAMPAALLVSGAGVLLTGGLHEDGLADTFDGLGGGRSRERVLAILRDSRIGSYGALALVHGLGLRVAALAATERGAWMAGLILAHAGGRLVGLALMRALPYARPEDPGIARQVVEAAGWGALAVGAGTFAAVAAALGGLATALPAAASGALLGAWYRTRLGGVTGDLVGASVVIGEVGILLAWAGLHPG